MRLPVMLVFATLFTGTAWDEVCAQSLTLTVGMGRACHGSDGSVCRNSSTTAVSTVGARLSGRWVIAGRVSRFDNAFTGEASYYDGAEPREVARVRHDSGRTMKYGAELLFYPSSLAGRTLSAFIGGGAGVRTFQHRATCAFGACHEPGPYAAVLGTERVRHGYVSFVAGVDAAVAYGVLVRGTVRLDDFTSSIRLAASFPRNALRTASRPGPSSARI